MVVLRPAAIGAQPRTLAKPASVVNIAIWCIVLLIAGGINAKLMPDSRQSLHADMQKSALTEYLFLLTAAICGGRLLVSGRRLLRVIAASYPIILFIMYCAIGLLFAVNPAGSGRLLIDFMAAVTIAFALCARLTPHDIARCVVAVMATTIMLSMFYVALLPQYGIEQAGGKSGLGEPGDWLGVFWVKNIAGHVAGIYTGGLLAARGKYFKNRILWGLCVLFGLALMIKSNSTSALFLCSGAYGAFWGLNRRSKVLRAWIMLFGVLTAIAVATDAKAILSGIFSAAGKDITLNGRTQLWVLALKDMGHNILTGWGYAYTETPGAVDRFTAETGLPNYHNAYLALVVNVGIIGAIIYFGWILTSVLTSLRLPLTDEQRDTRNLLLSVLFGCLLSGITEINSTSSSGVLIILVLVVTIGLNMLAVSVREALSKPPLQTATLRPIVLRVSETRARP